MPSRADESVEIKIRSAREAFDYSAATTLAVRAYGPEVLGFLEARLRDATRAANGSTVMTLSAVPAGVTKLKDLLGTFADPLPVENGSALTIRLPAYGAAILVPDLN